jgi:translation initiation factor 3 subunit C
VLKACDAHSNEYVDRLKDEPRVVSILEKAEKLIQKTGSPSEVCRIYLKRIEHIYFKFDPSVLDQKAGKLEANKETSLQVRSMQQPLEILCSDLLQFNGPCCSCVPVLPH